MIEESLINYIETNILPHYEGFDPAHRVDHATMVIEQSLAIAEAVMLT